MNKKPILIIALLIVSIAVGMVAKAQESDLPGRNTPVYTPFAVATATVAATPISYSPLSAPSILFLPVVLK